MSKFELLNHEVSSGVVEHTYFIQDDQGKIVYTEWVEYQGKVNPFTFGYTVIDSVLRDKDGYEIDNPELLEQVQEFIDSLES